MTHVINRLRFEVDCPDEDHAFNLRHNFSVTTQECIMEVVDSVCSHNVSEEEYLRIDRIEINLGHFTPYDFDSNFEVALKDVFEKELVKRLFQFSLLDRKISLQLSQLQLFEYFLEKGTLPWWADELQIDLEEISVNVLKHQPNELKYFFYNHRFHQYVWKRIALQLNKEAKFFIVELVEELNNARLVIDVTLQEIQDYLAESTGITFSNSNERVNKVVVMHAPTIFMKAGDQEVLPRIVAENIEELIPEIKGLVLEPLFKEKFLFQTGDKGSDQREFSNSQPGKDLLQTPSSTLVTATNKSIIASKSEEQDNEEEKYFVKQAGIVLLAPFLKPFFDNLHLLTKGGWKSKDDQYKAVHLLKFLSTGRQKLPEYNLTLEKLICGVAIEEPIPLDIVLQEDEIKEAETLLTSVIGHWKAIKNTSMNGLRETYLKRDGLLKRRDNGWLLQVERKTLDVIIDNIPWGYSTITFPWNAYLIFVEW